MKPAIFPCLALTLLAAGCATGPRMTIATGTSIGLQATPGDAQTRPPQVTFAYKRSELAIVPTGQARAKKKNSDNSDAYSSFAVVDFKTKWFKDTELRQFVASGHAARDIQETNSEFPAAMVAASTSILDPVSATEQIRINKAIRGQLAALPDIPSREAKAQQYLDALGIRYAPGTALKTLSEVLSKPLSKEQLTNLNSLLHQPIHP